MKQDNKGEKKGTGQKREVDNPCLKISFEE